MSDYKQKLSAFLDDAASAEDVEQLISASDRNDALATRYRLIGDALRDEISQASFIDVAARVRAGIEHDRSSVQPAAPARARTPLFDFGAWARPAVGMAMAASVAMIVVVSVVQFETSSPDAMVAEQPAPVSAEATKVASTIATPGSANGGSQLQQPRAVPVNLNSYLKEHAEFASQDTVMRRMPYARAVSYESR